MGIFVSLYKDRYTHVPEDKVPEFRSKAAALYRAGGMMNTSVVGKSYPPIRVISLPTEDQKRLVFSYNYFDDASWPITGYHEGNAEIFSDKVGGNGFIMTVLAAYTLESLFLDGPSALDECEDWFPLSYMAWLNFLFPGAHYSETFDAWSAFQAVHDATCRYADWNRVVERMDFVGQALRNCVDHPCQTSVISALEIMAVLEGTACCEAFMTRDGKNEKSGNPDYRAFLVGLKDALNRYRASSSLDAKEQLGEILHALATETAQESLELAVFGFMAWESNMPAYVAAVMAESFEMDFWDLWRQIPARCKKRRYDYREEPAPVSTQEYLGVSSDDMIPWWTSDGNVRFSADLESWFEKLRSRYDGILVDGIEVEKPRQWILNILFDAEVKYFHIHAFAGFLEESFASQDDQRILALWKIFEEMVNDPELEKIGSQLFPGPGEEIDPIRIDVVFPSDGGERLKRSWALLDEGTKFNRARVTLKRYLALVGNNALRKEVFGF